MVDFIIYYFIISILFSIILYIMTCLKYSKIAKIAIIPLIRMLLFCPFLIIMVIWKEL